MADLRRRDLFRSGLAALGTALGAPSRGHAAPAPAFPLRAAPDGRFLEDQDGRPFLIVGDSPQAIYARPTPAEVQTYLATRRAQGFTALLADPGFTNNNDGRVRPAANGALPFLRTLDGSRYEGVTGTADLATPDPTYWDYVDTVLAEAEAQGFVVLQYVLAWGYRGRSFWQDLIAPGNSAIACFAFGSFLGQRFRARANIIWIDGSDSDGDYILRSPDGTSGIARALAIVRGMRAAGAMQLRTGDWAADSLSTDQPAFAAQMTVNGIYAYGSKPDGFATYMQARRAWQYTPPLPAFLKETGYETERMIPGDPASVRKYQYWCLLSGATAGVVYGHGDIWPFTPGRWQAALDSPGAHDMQRMAALMQSLAWAALVPSGLSGMRRLVVSRNGSWSPPVPDYVAAAATPDGTLLLAYIPSAGHGPQRLALDLGGMRAGALAEWWDPTSGRRVPTEGDLRAAPAQVATPGDNAGGDNDWVLIVTAA